MKETIIKTRINLDNSPGAITITKSFNDYGNQKGEQDYYVVEWKGGHYEIEDVITECKDVIKALEYFKSKLNKANSPQLK